MPLKGFKHSKETKEKMSKKHKEIGSIPPNAKGKKRSEKSKIKYSLSKIGEKNPMKRKEVALKVSLAQKGEKSIRWQGGISFEPYSIDWNKTLKRSIRERDRYTCQICGKPQEDNAHHVHHIDYNKKNCNPNNLITLCVSCHIKTNQNREYWKQYFKQK